MLPEQAFLALRDAGIRPFIEDGKLRLAPPEAVTPELLELAKANKPDLLALLANPREVARLERLHADQVEMEVFFESA